MLMIFGFVIIGILLCKKRILPGNADLTVSRLFVYVFNAAVACYTMMQYCTLQSIAENAKLILIGFVMNVISILVAYPLSRLFVRNAHQSQELEYKRDIYKYCLAYSNYGTLGSVLILGIANYELLFKYFMFKLTMDFLSASWGLYTLLPKDGSASMSKNILRGFLTPPTIGLMVGMVLGIINFRPFMMEHLPFLESLFANASNAMGPIAMIITGLVVGKFDIKEMFKNAKAYILTAMRLVILPVIILLILRLLNASNDLMMFAIIAYAAPVGMNVILYPTAFGGDAKTGASMVMISMLLASITIPLMFMFFGIQL